MLHYIITRFNLRLWTHNKTGKIIEREKWLERRFDLFEKYCLPSVIAQTNKNFTWFLLFDNETPEKYKDRVKAYKSAFPQIKLIGVNPAYSTQFISIIQDIVRNHAREHLKSHPDEDTLITTYLDNDDALRYDFVEKVHKVASTEEPRTFISFVNGIQYYTELKIATRIKYRNNHFISFTESLEDISKLMTVYGFGSHFYIDTFTNCKHHYIDSDPMWVEVVHEENVDNDVKMTLHTKLFFDKKKMECFGNQLEISRHSKTIFLSKFVWRWIRQLIRRTIDKIKGNGMT